MISKILTIIMVGSFLIFAARGLYRQFSLRNTHELTTGIITDYSYSMNGGKLSFYFDYEVDGKKYSRSSVHSDVRLAYVKYFMGKRFPVAYKKDDVEHCQLIITRLDFKEFGIPFPDSLKWIRPYEYN